MRTHSLPSHLTIHSVFLLCHFGDYQIQTDISNQCACPDLRLCVSGIGDAGLTIFPNWKIEQIIFHCSTWYFQKHNMKLLEARDVLYFRKEWSKYSLLRTLSHKRLLFWPSRSQKRWWTCRLPSLLSDPQLQNTFIFPVLPSLCTVPSPSISLQ